MAPLESAYALAVVLLLVCVGLSAYAGRLKGDLVCERESRDWWRDTYAREAHRHAQTRDALEQHRMTRRSDVMLAPDRDHR